MNLFKKISTGTLALVLATGIAGSVVAQGHTAEGSLAVQIDQMSNGGVVTASVENIDFGNLQYAIVDQKAPGTLKIKASDLRGDATGWSVTISGTDFNSDAEFGIKNLSLTGKAVTTTSHTRHSTEAQPVQSTVQEVSDKQESTLLTAVKDTGAGKYDATYDANLNIPAGTLVGEYKATVTVTITGNQPGD